MQQKDWLSAEEVAKKIKVSAMTIKRNCQTYSSFLKFQQGEKNKYLIQQESIPVFQFIAKMRNKRYYQLYSKKNSRGNTLKKTIHLF